jgi:chloramphenicol 3-O-phosphotransferase
VRDWIAAPGVVLFCPGAPSAGKSVLVSAVVDIFAASDVHGVVVGCL